MGKEEVEFMPSGLVTCFLNDSEVRIIKISPKRITLRVSEKLKEIKKIKAAFYIFNEYRYEEVKIDNFRVIDEVIEEMWVEYTISTDNELFAKNVINIFRDYSKYIMLKSFGEEGEFSQDMMGYPAEKDYDFYKYYDDEKKEWMHNLNFKNSMDIQVELAVKIDNYVLYEEYLKRDINSFKEYYYKKNYLYDSCFFKKEIDRVYIGNEFCHNLFPKKELLIDMFKKAVKENLEITLCFTYLRENFIEENRDILERVYNLCVKENKKIEIVINDWGMLELIKDKDKYFKPVLGVLLNKRKKDPRYIYKKGYKENKELMGENSLNSSMFSRFLKEYNIERYEYESCGYKIKIAEGKHSLQLPFYVTNVSQYCPLNAVCKRGARGKQGLVKSCPKYCKDYVFMYPKHLKMVGRYNSLFSFDDTLLKDEKKLKEYIDEGINRIILNFV